VNGTLALLREARRHELEQAHFYRLLAGDAERAGEAATAERLNDLLADEQHHVSRLTARILELGGKPEDAGGAAVEVPALGAWEGAARGREEREVSWYADALGRVDDPETLAILAEILDAERHHRDTLAGKWMSAGPARATEAT
jgi:rubrerythrin